jgi:hypothetical protein
LVFTHRDDRKNVLKNQMKPLPKPVGFLISGMTSLREGGNRRKVVLKVLSVVRNGEPAGTRTQDPRLKSSKRPNYQWLDFAKVSPFFLCEQALETILYIPLILWSSIHYADV